jgi:hypothetical protein
LTLLLPTPIGEGGGGIKDRKEEEEASRIQGLIKQASKRLDTFLPMPIQEGGGRRRRIQGFN